MAKMDLTGQKFGRWTVLKEVEKDHKHNRRMWLCRCECGNEKVVPGITMTTGDSQSCGCLQRERAVGHGVTDLVGQKFGRLTVINQGGRTRTGHIKWLCQCECGKQKEIIGTNLTRGLTTSCGCYSTESHTKHGLTNTPEYMSWQHMKDRCLNPESDNYPEYGGRGIMVSPRWLGEHGFENFLSDMGPRPKGTSLDRWPNNDTGHYGPDNCRWGTGGEQMRNTRRTHWIEYNGERKVLTDWVKLLGMRHSEFYRHLRKGKTGPEVIEYYLKRANASNSGQHIEHN
jgi:hypothetical protein